MKLNVNAELSIHVVLFKEDDIEHTMCNIQSFWENKKKLHILFHTTFYTTILVEIILKYLINLLYALLLKEEMDELDGANA